MNTLKSPHGISLSYVLRTIEITVMVVPKKDLVIALPYLNKLSGQTGAKINCMIKANSLIVIFKFLLRRLISLSIYIYIYIYILYIIYYIYVRVCLCVLYIYMYIYIYIYVCLCILHNYLIAYNTNC